MPEPELLPHLGERYTILRRIGSGGMGHVYLARDNKHKRNVAIKVLRADVAESVGAGRFIQEIEIAAQLSHPNIVPLYDSGEVDGQLYFVMPHIEGETLRERLDRELMLPVDQALEWALEIGEGLAFLHQHGVIHRDIKPQNLLLQSGRILIADLGIAKAADIAAAEGMTGQDLVLGTPIYMSPEQASGGKVDPRSDLYSLACVVYEMLAGEPPFQGATAQALLTRKASGRFPRLRVVRPTVPRAVERTLARALAPVPADRFATVDEFCRTLRAAISGSVGRAAGAVLLLCVLAGIVWLALRPGSPAEVPGIERDRVVVGRFDNRTGDTHYDALGIMAADWITEGLQRTGAIEVVPTVTALSASRYVKTSGATGDPVQTLARETSASLVVTGSIYLNRDSLIVQAQLSDAGAGRLVGAVEPVRVDRSGSMEALQEVRERLMGLLALNRDERVTADGTPPRYEAYEAFSEGLDAYVLRDYVPALSAFQRAYAEDSSFVLPLLYASLSHSNQGHFEPADSVIQLLAKHRDRLNPHDRFWLDYRTAELAGNDVAALAALRGAAQLAPSSKATFNFAVQAFEARLPVQAESALVRLPPDVGPMRGWLAYWEVWASALHVQGKHRQELKVAREARRRFPELIQAYIFESRAQAAMNESDELEDLWSRALGEPSLRPAQRGELAYDIGAELWIHTDSSKAREWFQRAYDQFGSSRDAPLQAEAQWGRVRAGTRLGRLKEAYSLSEALARGDTSRYEYSGWQGLVAAQFGDRVGAKTVQQQLASTNARFAYGDPQFQAARIAAVLGNRVNAEDLLARALERGYPYDIEFHRDFALASLQGTTIMRRMSARPRMSPGAPR